MDLIARSSKAPAVQVKQLSETERKTSTRIAIVKKKSDKSNSLYKLN